jgi:hypothetical protein
MASYSRWRTSDPNANHSAGSRKRRKRKKVDGAINANSNPTERQA